MLDILRGEKSANPDSRYSSVKLISGTNPLSALLRRELKHKIVTNSCSFRTPDPTVTVPRSLQRKGYGIHGYDWEQFYRNCGTPPARMQYLCAMGCFELPSPSECSHLLEIYFTRVHPLLPVIDRKEFLAAYYGSASPPSLLLLRAIFLAATRYTTGESGTSMEEIRPHCDDLHTKLRALIKAGLSMERIPVIQATIIASLHWEGREGLNSAIDNLSLAIRLCQEMGLHRKLLIDQSPAPANHALLRRIWWVVYALDRFNAAQEGTPFLINEIDCDVEPLSKTDLKDEDPLTSKVTLLNMSMALLIEEAIRKLYAPGEDHITLFTPRGGVTSAAAESKPRTPRERHHSRSHTMPTNPRRTTEHRQLSARSVVHILVDPVRI
ncbi:Transcriptional activator of fatty acid utilization [Fusarium falciforme]|nr:Transcriptional activator of fatty acid utilization [Fusarium falciforme]